MVEEFIELFGQLLPESQLFERRNVFALHQDPHDDPLTVIGRQYRDPHIEGFPGDGDLCPSVLRYPLFRDVKPGDDFDPVDHEGGDVFVEIEVFGERSIDPEAHFSPPLVRFDMDITRPPLDRLEKERIDHLYDGGGLFGVEEIL